jgi:hypothetical protein
VAAGQKETLLLIEGKNIAAKKAAKPDRATGKKEDWWLNLSVLGSTAIDRRAAWCCAGAAIDKQLLSLHMG